MESPHMDGSLWGQLPENLIELVLAKLPPANLLRLRTVCTKWKELMATKCFLETCAEGAPCFAKVSYREDGRWLTSYDPSIPKWYDLPMEYLPSAVGFPLSSSGGLICYDNRRLVSVRKGPMLFVTNPLTKTWKKLPCGFPWERLSQYKVITIPVVSMIMWKRPAHYKVIVVREANTQIYDSVEGAWRSTKCLLHEDVLRKEVHCRVVMNVHNGAFCNGSLYLLTPSNRTLMAFSIQDEVWSIVQSGGLPGYRKFRKLAMCNGHIVIVGKSFQEVVCVWFLDMKTMKWCLGGRMPQNMSENLPDFLRCFPVIQFSSYGDSIFFESSRHDVSFLFNMAQGTWCSVVHWPIISCEDIAYEPRLDAQV